MVRVLALYRDARALSIALYSLIILEAISKLALIVYIRSLEKSRYLNVIHASKFTFDDGSNKLPMCSIGDPYSKRRLDLRDRSHSHPEMGYHWLVCNWHHHIDKGFSHARGDQVNSLVCRDPSDGLGHLENSHILAYFREKRNAIILSPQNYYTGSNILLLFVSLLSRSSPLAQIIQTTTSD